MLNTLVSTATSSIYWRELLEEVYKGRPIYEFKGGCCIPLHLHDVWIVSRGVIQLSTIYSDGSEATLGLVYPDMPFGLPLTQIEPYIASALFSVDLMRFSQTEIEESTQLTHGVLLQLNRHLQQTEALLALINQRLVSVRLQKLLLLLTRELGQTTPDGIRIKIRFTHQHLASLVGTTRISVTRVLGYLRKEGWLSIDNANHIVVHDSATLSLAIRCRTTAPTSLT